MLLQPGFTKHLNILRSPYGWLFISCTAFVLYYLFSKPFGRLDNLSSFCLLRTSVLIQPDLIQSSLLLPLLQWENCVTHRRAAGVRAPCPAAGGHRALQMLATHSRRLPLCRHWCFWWTRAQNCLGNKDLGFSGQFSDRVLSSLWPN